MFSLAILPQKRKIFLKGYMQKQGVQLNEALAKVLTKDLPAAGGGHRES